VPRQGRGTTGAEAWHGVVVALALWPGPRRPCCMMVTLERERVVVTGLGVISGLGESPAAFWDGLRNGRSAIGPWHSRDPRLECKIGGDMSLFSLEEHLTRVGADYPRALAASARKLLRATPLSGRMTAAAALQAWVDAGLPGTPVDPDRFGHVCAGHNLTTPYLIENARTFQDEPDFIDPLFGMMVLDTDVVAVTSELLTLRGPAVLIGGACASGNLAAIAALDLIRAGRVDGVVLTGAASALEETPLMGWLLFDALSFRSFNDRPERASRPFDVRREGFVPSEAAAAVVLESLTSARRRGATLLGELCGGASVSDASRLPKPHVDGQRRAMLAALRDARLTPDDVDYVNAHATSTPLGDVVEVTALKEVLGARARKVPINATKSMTGHALTSAGVLEIVATLLQMRHGLLHPTINLDEPERELDLDFVPHVAREHEIHVALSNSFGFGGINSCVVVGRAPG
jgi:3-oxoacyl-(acyl-carrier-protein) synthase